jgi:hypothetical protein
MKSIKMIFLMMLVGMTGITSCSTEKEELQEKTSDLTKGNIERYEKTESVELEVIEIVKKDVEGVASRSVRWCPNYGNPHHIKDGFGIAQVTLDDGSVHYAAANWENHGSCCGGLSYEVYYIGTSLPSNYSC